MQPKRPSARALARTVQMQPKRPSARTPAKASQNQPKRPSARRSQQARGDDTNSVAVSAQSRPGLVGTGHPCSRALGTRSEDEDAMAWYLHQAVSDRREPTIFNYRKGGWF